MLYSFICFTVMFAVVIFIAYYFYKTYNSPGASFKFYKKCPKCGERAFSGNDHNEFLYSCFACGYSDEAAKYNSE